MKKIAIGALTVLVGGIVAIIIAAAAKPDTFQVRRSLVMKAPPEAIARHIVDFRQWTSWSPYEKYDPSMKRTYRGPMSGEGAIYEWKGNSDIGSGRMEITGVTPSRISIKLDFFEPIEGNNIAEFLFEPEGRHTKVTWEMHGPNRFIGKIIHVFISMDGMVGKDFDTGLRNLKALAEKKK